MSLSGLRKQFNKANQYLSETVGAAEPTKLDDEYNEMERKVDMTYELISALIAGTHEYLQPNPATRAKMATMGALSKVRGATNKAPYPQTEGLLAETMSKYGKAMGEQSDLGRALNESSEAYKQMADIRYELENAVTQNFLDPLAHLQNTDLKEVNHHRGKLKGRRLDYDCKKRKTTRDEELIQAEEKLEESKRLAEQAMFNVLSNDVEQVSQLCALVDAQLEFHRKTASVLESLRGQLQTIVRESSTKPRQQHHTKPVFNERDRSPIDSRHDGGSPSMPSAYGHHPQQAGTLPAKTANGGLDDWGSVGSTLPPQARMNVATAPPAAQPTAQRQSQKPCVKALFDFEPENPGELGFKENEIIELVAVIDENWYEGRLNGKSGFFPISYVQVVVPLPT